MAKKKKDLAVMVMDENPLLTLVAEANEIRSISNSIADAFCDLSSQMSTVHAHLEDLQMAVMETLKNLKELEERRDALQEKIDDVE